MRCVCVLELRCFLQPNAEEYRISPAVDDDVDETGSDSESPLTDSVSSHSAEEPDAYAAATIPGDDDDDDGHRRGVGGNLNLFSC